MSLPVSDPPAERRAELPAQSVLPPRPAPAKTLPPPPSRRRRATLVLLLATTFWGLSFPLAKGLALAQRGLLPLADSWFLAAISLVVRFGVASALVALGSLRTLRLLNGGELRQGLGLGLFSGFGLLLQMDGLSYTSASTSAFLTSCYCVVIPLIVAARLRRFPPLLVMASCALVVAGMALLAGVDWRTLRLGRGEWETVLASMFFAGQILWLERPVFAANRTAHATLVMFLVITAVCMPVALAHTRARGDLWVAVAGSPVIVGFLLALTILCTLCAFSMMNHWQRFLEATEAGLIYCGEPVFASVFALFLPAWLSAVSGASYPNETLTIRLLIGGALITVANALIQLRPAATLPAPAPAR